MNFSRHEGKTALFVLILITSKGTSDNENIFKLSVPTSLRFSVLNFLKNTFFLSLSVILLLLIWIHSPLKHNTEAMGT